jgi:hypothetical protein
MSDYFVQRAAWIVNQATFPDLWKPILECWLENQLRANYFFWPRRTVWPYVLTPDLCSEEGLPQDHFVQHKSHTDCYRIDSGLNCEKLAVKCLSWHSLGRILLSIHIFEHTKKKPIPKDSDSSNHYILNYWASGRHPSSSILKWARIVRSG